MEIDHTIPSTKRLICQLLEKESPCIFAPPQYEKGPPINPPKIATQGKRINHFMGPLSKAEKANQKLPIHKGLGVHKAA